MVAVKITKTLNKLNDEQKDNPSNTTLQGTKEAIRKLWIIVGSVLIVNLCQLVYQFMLTFNSDSTCHFTSLSSN
jgi:hypothetical protein